MSFLEWSGIPWAREGIVYSQNFELSPLIHYNVLKLFYFRSVNLKGNALSGSLSGILDNDNIEALDLSSNDLSGTLTLKLKKCQINLSI